MRRLEYVWQLPVRITHWIVAGAILVLSVTGIFIGGPYLYGGFITRYMIDTHLVLAYVLLCAVVWRIAWAFMGNRWSSWRAFVPFITREGWRRMYETFLFYVFLRRRAPAEKGHNALAAIAYLFVYALLAIEIFTGFSLYTFAWSGTFARLFDWIFLFAPVNYVRLTHHMVMWLLLGFTVHHIYSAVLMDCEERSGVLSSIVTGFKFLRRGE